MDKRKKLHRNQTLILTHPSVKPFSGCPFGPSSVDTDALNQWIFSMRQAYLPENAVSVTQTSRVFSDPSGDPPYCVVTRYPNLPNF